MSKSGKIALGILIGFGILVFLGMGSVSIQPISQTKPSEPLVTKQSAFKQAFMGGCNPDGKTLGYCSCLWTKMETKYTTDEIEAIGNEYSQTGKMTQAFTDFITACAKQYQTELQGV